MPACFSRFVSTVLCAVTLACASTPKVAELQPEPNLVPEWETTILKSHPLVGRLWSTEAQRFVTTEALKQSVQASSMLFLGERHDHPDHHRVQARVLEFVAPKSTIAFEMLDEEDVPRIEGVREPEAFRKASEWDQSGWPKFDLYRPIFEVIYRRNLHILAAHPSRSRLMGMARAPDKYREENAARLGRISAGGQATLRRDIDRGHCGQANAAVVAMMMNAQTFKDEWMIKQLRHATGPQTVVIAGNGHVRDDYGLQNHFDGPALSLGIIEVQADQMKAQDYDPQRYDFLFFTPRLDNLDPCEKYKEALKKMKEKYRKSAPKH